MKKIGFKYNDGGRKKAGFKRTTGDCGVRAIAIATQKPYMEVYNIIKEFGRSGQGYKNRRNGITSTVHRGIWQKDMRKIMASLNWEWIPTMFIGVGCTVHLNTKELPNDRIICNVSKHYTAVINGIINDTYDCSRYGNRCVYGYYIKKK